MSGAKKSALRNTITTDTQRCKLDMYIVRIYICGLIPPLLVDIVIFRGNANFDAPAMHRDIFDAETGVWTELPDVITERPYYPSPVAIQHGEEGHRIYLFGGGDRNMNILDSCAFIDVGEYQWTVLEAKMTTPRAFASAILLDRTTIVICGGYDDDGNELSSCESLDLNTHTFSPHPDMLQPRYYHAGVHYNGTIVVLGGSPDDGTCEQFDPAVFEWTPFAPLPGKPHEDVKAAVVEDKIYALIVHDTSVQVYDGTTWTAVPQFPKTSAYRSVVALGGKVVVIGTDTDAFDPVTGVMSRLSAKPHERYTYGAVSF